MMGGDACVAPVALPAPSLLRRPLSWAAQGSNPTSQLLPLYTGRFFRKGTSEGRGVILSAAKDLSPGTTQIQSSRSEPALERSEGMTASGDRCVSNNLPL